MKNKFFVILLLVLFGFTTNISFAETTYGISSNCVSLQNNLKYGMRDYGSNTDVTLLQKFLQRERYLSVDPTGFYGPMTLQSIKNFQKYESINNTA